MSTKEPFVYLSQLMSFDAGLDSPAAFTSIPITREADFYCSEIRAISSVPAAILLRDSTADRMWFNLPMHTDLIKDGIRLDPPRFIHRAAVVNVEGCNLADVPNKVRVALIGYKEFINDETLKVTKLGQFFAWIKKLFGR